MPKIDAPTVAEHRAQVSARLVDAAEEILRRDPGGPLSAKKVSAAAGIARNSIYRYVDSVDDLRGMVVGRHLPNWMAAVDEAVAAAVDPRERIVTWVRANLDEAASTGHGWLMLAAGAASGAAMDASMERAHAGMRDQLGADWEAVLGDGQEGRVRTAVALTVGILDAGFRELDAGQPAGQVRGMVDTAANALVTAF